MNSIRILLIPLLLLQATMLVAAEGFPVRELYPKVKPIELEELYRKREEVLIFDVRSTYEFETLHIKNASHLALNDPDFVAILKKIRNKDKRPFVFYCNGHTCKKSYKATQKAMHGRLNDVYVFDAGIFEWTKAHPEEAVLLGQSPVKPSQLISKKKLDEHMLDPEAFGRRVNENSIVLDIRDSLQKNALNLFPMQQRSVPLDNRKLKTYVDMAKRDNKTLLIYDAVGKQVRWLQYYLEAENIKSYYFMKGGAKAFLNY